MAQLWARDGRLLYIGGKLCYSIVCPCCACSLCIGGGVPPRITVSYSCDGTSRTLHASGCGWVGTFVDGGRTIAYSVGLILRDEPSTYQLLAVVQTNDGKSGTYHRIWNGSEPPIDCSGITGPLDTREGDNWCQGSFAITGVG